MNEPIYHGDGRSPSGNGQPFPYLADDDLKVAVTMAITLHRPLLVKGAPGCGKTTLAASISHELVFTLYRWYVKSTSRARDGLYTIDVVRRLQDAQLPDPKAQKLTPYIRFGPLGEAIKSPKPSVVLIDEIDKADIDFPNDLLRELEEFAFTIEELDESDLDQDDLGAGFRKTFEAITPPIVIITSNDERELPDAFLRRCLFHYIEFPAPDRLHDIVKVNTPDLNVEQRLIEQAIERYGQIRDLGGFRKEPSTSELIEWIRILHLWGVQADAVEGADALSDLPYWTMLFKHQADRQRLQREVSQGAPP